MARKFSLFSVALLALVGVGFASELYNNPAGLIRSILITVVIAGVLYFLFTRFMTSRGAGMFSSSTDKGYERALRQQKQRNKKSLQQSAGPELKKMNRLKSLTRRDHPFKVIDGKKNKSGKRSKTS
ncbi:SA1362 family protein [Aneurinibacillus uraniidurans]|uniref:SA1362 family protein n=1 Tax=Aneurinibacillus uraniidurans TaxID=2966586 RepID=UPI00234A7310|nr:SA1362 family protein [Aneurinibacillus sp. B1]WCN38914.1 hypothetical protein PO771_05825 [Aneurinibacillus sp. B1]